VLSVRLRIAAAPNVSMPPPCSPELLPVIVDPVTVRTPLLRMPPPEVAVAAVLPPWITRSAIVTPPAGVT
jgi:hypothetical protein